MDSLRALVEECQIELPPGLPPGGASLIGFFAYDFVRLIERLPSTKPDDLELPDVVLIRPTVVIVFDNVSDLMTVVTPVYPSAGVSAAAAYRIATERLADVVAELRRGLPYHSPPSGPVEVVTPVSNFTKDQYMAMVEAAKEYIRSGDAFQVVPSQRFSMPFRLPALALYRSLRRLNPSPFSFHLNLGDFALISSSPEILVRLRDGTVTVRPIAGTRRRGATRQVWRWRRNCWPTQRSWPST